MNCSKEANAYCFWNEEIVENHKETVNSTKIKISLRTKKKTTKINKKSQKPYIRFPTSEKRFLKLRIVFSIYIP